MAESSGAFISSASVRKQHAARLDLVGEEDEHVVSLAGAVQVEDTRTTAWMVEDGAPTPWVMCIGKQCPKTERSASQLRE